MKAILVCSGGMSTSILIDALVKEAAKINKEFSAIAIGVNEIETKLENCDIVLVAPQIKYKFSAIQEAALAKNIKIYQIEPTEYTPIGAPRLINSIVNILGE